MQLKSREHTRSTTVKRLSRAAHLQVNVDLVVQEQVLVQKIGANGRLVLVYELFLDVLVHQRSFSNAKDKENDHAFYCFRSETQSSPGVPKDDDLEQGGRFEWS